MSKTSRKICVVTGTRAEYGLLHRVMQGIHDSEELKLQLVVTGMHLSPEFGHTIQEIEDNGFKIDRRVEMLLSSDTTTAITKSMGLALISFADSFEELKPDLLRYSVIALKSSQPQLLDSSYTYCTYSWR